MADKQLVCIVCKAMFAFTEGEQEFYASKKLSAPQRCKQCRQSRKEDGQEKK